MTVTYTGEVATCRGLGCFLKLLTRWKGSIYKLVWLDLIVFLLIYYGLNLTYRLLLDAPGKALFEAIVNYCYDYGSLIPLSFVLGFYVSVVMTRWWNQYTTIPFPDPLAVFVSATVHGQDERGRVMRRTIMRYVCLCVTMTFTMISPRVKKRFPTLDHFVEAGLLHQSEKEIMVDLNNKFPKYSKHWLPIVWASSIITRARKEGRIRDDFAVKTLIDELNKFRGQCGLLLSYDTISVPLVYTQVVTLAVYSYFLTTLMGHQWVENSHYKFDLYFPVFTTLQFFFYVGWLKVAESLINPFGDDDDDFEVNWMVDRNLQISYLIVDEMHHEHPELVRDQYWDEIFPQGLPYTPAAAAAESMRNTHPLPSTANIAVRPEEQGTPQIKIELTTASSLKLDQMQALAAENMQSGPIIFSARQPSMKSRKNSSTSLAMDSSVPDSMQRVASVVSMTNKLKRFFSRDESKSDSRGESNIELGQEMNTLIPDDKKFGTTTKKITDEVIEEVDEQNTITSQRPDDKEVRPTVMEIFGPPAPSKPIDVPYSSSYSIANHNTEVYDPYPPLSRSAPAGDGGDGIDKVSIGSQTDEEEDDFELLKKKRDEERFTRLKHNIARSLSINKDETLPENELLLKRQIAVVSSSPPRSPQ
ncbi:bestrophin 1 isoform X2 [Rhynchophorus ferrugineus]|uniref:bestrophin 1 isoform X2 n=1 Tax=Rhynchophorus ferrugineus TaxID=354439 RepID=UPI003FCD1D08